MKSSEVHGTIYLGAHYHPNQLAEFLSMAVSGRPFTHVEPIYGLPNSARVLMPNNREGGTMASFDQAIWPYNMALELERLANSGEARYDAQPREGMQKGWEVRRSTFHGDPAAIVYATWI